MRTHSSLLMIVAAGGLALGQSQAPPGQSQPPAAQTQVAPSAEKPSSGQSSAPATGNPQTQSPSQTQTAAPTQGLPPSADEVPIPGDANAASKGSATELGPAVELPALNDPHVTLLGGTVTKLDFVRDRFTLRAFAGKPMVIAYDTRTKFYLDGNLASQRDLKTGQRVHIDTTLDSADRVFVKSVWIQSEGATGNGRGQVVAYYPSDQILVVRDELSAQPMRFKLTPTTAIKNGDKAATASDLTTGSLVTLVFGPQQGNVGTVNEVAILARPGSQFTFFGRITYIDLARRRFAVSNRSDQKSYELDGKSVPDNVLSTLHEGTEVTVHATFDGRQYLATQVSATPAESSQTQQ